MSATSVVKPDTVDEYACRIVGAFVAMLAVVSPFGPMRWVLAVLAVDCAIRAFDPPRYSVLARLAAFTARAVGTTPKPVYAPPKRFAARIGLAFSGTAAVLWVIGLPVASTVVALMLAVAAALEAFVGFCLACWVYAYLPRPRSVVP